MIYLHCNATSRIEALELLPYLVECDIHLFCFDFSGCGLSEGEYVSLGVFEAQDLKCVVEFVRKNYGIRHIGIFLFGPKKKFYYKDYGGEAWEQSLH